VRELDRIRAVIVDDEPAAREVVRTLLDHHPRVEVVAEAANGADAVETVRAIRPDLLFLDIQMPGGDGFGVLTALGDAVPRGVVFVTAHDEHALRAFEVHALDYLLKPFGRPRFDAAVGRAIERLDALDALDALTVRNTVASLLADRTSGASAPPATLESGSSGVGRPLRRLGVRTGVKLLLVEVDDIDWIEALGDYVRIHVGVERHLLSQSLQALDTLLDPEAFLRIHRSTIVQLARIRELHRESDGGGAIVLRSGVRLRVARGRWEQLRAALTLESG
jgi:two-component system, LytTR family, response regulator